MNVFIEVSKNSNIKYEICKENNIIKLDRILSTSMMYPYNYGFLTNTLGDDNDELDILVLGDYILQPGSLINVKIIGVLNMTDEEGFDPKIISIPLCDPESNHINDINDVPIHILNKIEHFFNQYKSLENNKWVKVEGFADKFTAIELCNNAYNKFKDKSKL